MYHSNNDGMLFLSGGNYFQCGYRLRYSLKTSDLTLAVKSAVNANLSFWLLTAVWKIIIQLRHRRRLCDLSIAQCQPNAKKYALDAEWNVFLIFCSAPLCWQLRLHVDDMGEHQKKWWWHLFISLKRKVRLSPETRNLHHRASAQSSARRNQRMRHDTGRPGEIKGSVSAPIGSRLHEAATETQVSANCVMFCKNIERLLPVSKSQLCSPCMIQLAVG